MWILWDLDFRIDHVISANRHDVVIHDCVQCCVTLLRPEGVEICYDIVTVVVPVVIGGLALC